MWWAGVTSPEALSASAAVMSTKRDIEPPRRAASMDEHDVRDNDGRAAGCDDGGAEVHSAHSSPSRGRRKFTCLRKVTYCV